MINYIKNNFRGFILSILTTLIIGLLFLSYLYFVGIKKTQARNYYNLGTYQLELGNKQKAKELFEKANSYWHEDYIKKELQSL